MCNCISLIIRQSFSLPKQSPKSRSLGLLRKGKTSILAKFHRTDLVIYSHSRGFWSITLQSLEIL